MDDLLHFGDAFPRGLCCFACRQRVCPMSLSDKTHRPVLSHTHTHTHNRVGMRRRSCNARIHFSLFRSTTTANKQSFSTRRLVSFSVPSPFGPVTSPRFFLSHCPPISPLPPLNCSPTPAPDEEPSRRWLSRRFGQGTILVASARRILLALTVPLSYENNRCALYTTPLLTNNSQIFDAALVRCPAITALFRRDNSNATTVSCLNPRV
jgi:hypothetical protein